MRNMKKFLALVLAMMMMLSVAVFNTSAAEEADYTDAALFLNSLAVMQGSTDGDLMLDAGVERYQAALFFARCLTGKTETEIWNGTPASAYFTDVTMYGTAIDYAYGMGVVKGRGGNIFGATDKIIYQDMIVMAVRALGYETENMSYPWGHIIAAEKLDLLEDIDNVNYKAVMTRGEVAQLLKNTLSAQIARIDPVSKAPLYVGEVNSLNTTIVADGANTLLSKAGFAEDTDTTVTVTEFKHYTDKEIAEAAEDGEELVDTVTLSNGVIIAAADLGITVDTPKVNYLGLDVELYFSYEDGEVDFDQDNYDDGKLSVVYYEFNDYETVEALGDGNIKYTVTGDKHVLALGTTKLDITDGKTKVTVMTWTDAGWDAMDEADAFKLLATLKYEKGEYTHVPGEGNTKTTNAFGKVAFRTWTDAETEQAYAEVLVTPYSFAQYNERELNYAGTSKVETFVTLATAGEEKTNMFDEKTFFSNETFVTGGKLSKNVTKRVGETALAVKVVGEANPGDLVIYDYNSVDNILTIVANAGSIKTGRLSGQNIGKQTYTIDKTAYKLGFAAPGLTATNAVADVYNTVIAEKGNNVQYALYNGNVIFVAPYAEEVDAADVDFAVISVKPADLAEALDVEVEDLELNADGLLVEDGYVVVAMLNLTTGKWETANIAAVALTYNDAANVKAYKTLVDVAELAAITEYSELAGGDKKAAYDADNTNADKKAAWEATPLYKYTKAVEDLKEANIVVVVAEEDGAYTIAKQGVTNAPTLTSKAGQKLVFGANGLSNAVTADAEVEAERIQTVDNTVIVVINTDTKTVGVRTGVQNAKADIASGLTFYVAGADLIVATSATLDVADWAGKNIASENENYYVVLPGFNTDVNTTDVEGEYEVVVEGLYDLKAFAVADAITVTTKDLTIFNNFTNGKLIHKTEAGAYVVVADDAEVNTIAKAVKALKSDVEFTATGATINTFADANTMAIAGAEKINGETAISEITVNVATIDRTDIDWANADLTTMHVGGSILVDYDVPVGEYKEDDDHAYYAYDIDLTDELIPLNAPEAGVLDQFVIDMANEGRLVYVSDKEGNVESFKVVLNVAYAYDEKADTLVVYVVKELVAATTTTLKATQVVFADKNEAADITGKDNLWNYNIIFGFNTDLTVGTTYTLTIVCDGNAEVTLTPVAGETNMFVLGLENATEYNKFAAAGDYEFEFEGETITLTKDATVIEG